MFREVRLPQGVHGRLFLHAMPARTETWAEFVAVARAHGLTRMVSLTAEAEIAQKSAAYAEAVRRGELPCTRVSLPVPDFGVPEERTAFAELSREVAAQLRAGERVLVHCGAGIGRTGMFAACVLIALGLSAQEALAVVRAAGSAPETEEQRALVSACAELGAT